MLSRGCRLINGCVGVTVVGCISWALKEWVWGQGQGKALWRLRRGVWNIVKGAPTNVLGSL